MPYRSSTGPYINPSSGILQNKLGIASRTELDKAEADISTVILAALPENPITGDFDLAHLKAVHHALFQPLYAWAGELRTVELSKGSTRFANPEFLEKTATAIFSMFVAAGY